MPVFGKELQIAYKDYPLDPIHPWAKTAAIAGRCINKQKADVFWAYYDWIFAHQEQLTTENMKPKLLEFAKSHALEAAPLQGCLGSPETAAEVEESAKEGRALGVNSTPTMFLNGRRLVGSLPWGEMKEILTQELAFSKQGDPGGSGPAAGKGK